MSFVDTMSPLQRTPNGFALPRAARRYRAFGGVLESALAFPELVEATGDEPAQWTVRIVECEPPAVDVTLLGERQLGPEWYRLWRTPTGRRLEYSHAGVFELSAGGAVIVWYRRSDAVPELVRSIVLGPALALALELSGYLCLHGSAVAIGGKAIAFLGPKHHGKSTLAAALTAAGAQLIGDDLVAVSPGLPPMLRPGVPSVRLWDDAVGALPLGEMCDSVVRGVKTTASGFAERALTQGEIELAALYLLVPADARGGVACSRAAVSAGAAAIGLAHQTKLPDSLVGMSAAGAQLAAAARLAMAVPVFTLSPVRDLGRLPAVADQILAWHSSSQR